MRFWDINSGAEIATIKFPFGEVASGAFSPDGKLFAISRNNISLVEVRTGNDILTMENSSRRVSSAAFRGDYKTIIVSGESGNETARIWNLTEDVEPQSFRTYLNGSLQFSKDKRMRISS